MPKWNTNKIDLRKNIEFVLRIVEVFAIVAGVIFAIFQIKDVRDMQSADLMLKFSESLGSEKNSKIIYAIEEQRPIFKENKGDFDSTDIDNYLGLFELINTTFSAGLITNDMMYDAFSSYIVKTYDNPEIKVYLNTIRKQDALYFNGFEQLAKEIKVADKNYK